MYPGQENELSKVAKKMKTRKQLSKTDYGGSKNVSIEKVNLCATDGSGKCYGSRAIAVKSEDQDMSVLQMLHTLNEADDISALPDMVIKEIQGKVREGAKDLDQKWANALELAHKAYQVCNVRLPTPAQTGAWKQYEDMITYAVKQLAATRGLDGDWRMTSAVVVENENGKPQHIGTRRFFVEIPGAETKEVAAKDLDEIIDKITNKVRSSRHVHNTKVTVDHRTEHGAILYVWVDNVKREKVVIKQHA